MKSFLIPLVLLSSTLASSSQTIEGEERTYTSFKITYINTNNLVLPLLPPNTPTPLDISGVNTERALRKSAKRKRFSIVYYTEDWELEWLNFLKIILEEAQDVHAPCILEKREIYNARRNFSD